MTNSNEAIKILARRFVNLSPNVRVKVASRLLRWREEEDEAASKEKKYVNTLSCARRKSFLEQFWDEVEAAHGDGLYRSNPFSSGGWAQSALYAFKAGPEANLVHV